MSCVTCQEGEQPQYPTSSKDHRGTGLRRISVWGDSGYPGRLVLELLADLGPDWGKPLHQDNFFTNYMSLTRFSVEPGLWQPGLGRIGRWWC